MPFAAEVILQSDLTLRYGSERSMPIAKKGARTGSTNRSKRSRRPPTNLSKRFGQVSVAYSFNRSWGSTTDATQERRKHKNRPAHRDHRPRKPRGVDLAYARSLFLFCSALGRNRPLHPPPGGTPSGMPAGLQIPRGRPWISTGGSRTHFLTSKKTLNLLLDF